MTEGPRKLFKTISLVDRLRGSDYDTILPSPPVKDKSGEASVVLKSAEAQLNTVKKGVNLASIPDLAPKDPIILKTLIKSPNALLLPPNKFETSALKMSNIPPAKTQFANTISLEDRLSQKDVTKTNHLPQYFLSDSYTGYLTIAPFFTPKIDDTQSEASGNLDVQSSTTAITAKQTPEQLLDIPVSKKSTLQLQGTFIINNAFDSISQTETPLGDTATLTTQGVYIINNSPNSFVETVDSKATAQINQGSIELPIYEVAINQGAAIGLTQPPSLEEAAVSQGLFLRNGQVDGSLQQLEIIGYETDRALAFGSPAVKHGAANLIITAYQDSKSKSVETPLAVHGSVLLDVIKYETDRALAFGSPRVKHGTAQLAVSDYLENRTKAVNNPISIHGESPNPVKVDAYSKFIEHGAGDDTSPASPNISSTAYQPSGILPSPADVKDLGKFSTLYNDNNPGGSENAGAITDSWGIPTINANIGGGQGSLARYNSIAYGNIGQDPKPNYKKQANPGGSPFASYKGKVKPNSTSENDFIILKFTPIVGLPIRFKAYLTSFSDGMSANWNDIQYVGRIDTLKQYTGTTRALSLSFLLPAFSEVDVDKNMERLERLIGVSVVGSFDSGGQNFVSSPLVKIRVGGLINSYCAVNSVKWDFDPSEATFDVDKGMPHMFKVSVDAAVLGTSDDKLLNGADGNYFTSRYI